MLFIAGQNGDNLHKYSQLLADAKDAEKGMSYNPKQLFHGMFSVTVTASP